MANADKCHLNIPFKEYFKSFDPTDPASLKLAADREFENYKAIERRINDPACDPVGGPTSFCHAQSNSATISLVGATYGYADLTWAAIVEESGGWTISGGEIIAPDTSILYHVYVASSFTDASGTDAVNTWVSVTDNIMTFDSYQYVPGGWDSAPMAARLADMSTGISGFIVSGVLTAPAAATRSMGVYMELFAMATAATAPY